MSDPFENSTPADTKTAFSTGEYPAGQSPVPTVAPRAQFSLAALLLLTAMLAVGVTLLKLLGHWGLVMITAAGFAATFVSSARWQRSNAGPLFIQLLWGVVLPLLCFGYDPGILNSQLNRSTPGDAVIAIALWQMTLLCGWLFLGPRGPCWNGTMAGGLLVGMILAGLIAIPLLFLALLTVFVAFAYGLPGLAPLMTTWVFARNWNLACFLLPQRGRARFKYLGAAITSLLLALCLPPLLLWLANQWVGPVQFPSLPQGGRLSPLRPY